MAIIFWLAKKALYSINELPHGKIMNCVNALGRVIKNPGCGGFFFDVFIRYIEYLFIYRYQSILVKTVEMSFIFEPWS
jgi:hypothetical protein